MRDIDPGGGAVIIASGADRFRVAERRQILVQRFVKQLSPVLRASRQPEGVGVGLHHPLRLWRGQDHEKPVPVGAGELIRRVGVHLARWGDIQNAQFFDPVRMIISQPMRHAAAAIMAAEEKVAVAERIHHLGHVLRHRTLGIVDVIRPGRRL